jgi:uridine phosphorylase
MVGAPFAAAFLDAAIALGCRKFIACGSAGVLDRDIPVGSFIVPNAAIRDEGVSYHYVAPCREIQANPRAIAALTATLETHNEPYRIAKTWTTDAIFRETVTRVARRKAEGCATVEMEAAALMAVAQFRGVELGYILFGGDDVSGTEWDTRSNQPRLPISERILRLSLEACLRM